MLQSLLRQLRLIRSPRRVGEETGVEDGDGKVLVGKWVIDDILGERGVMRLQRTFIVTVACCPIVVCPFFNLFASDKEFIYECPADLSGIS